MPRRLSLANISAEVQVSQIRLQPYLCILLSEARHETPVCPRPHLRKYSWPGRLDLASDVSDPKLQFLLYGKGTTEYDNLIGWTELKPVPGLHRLPLELQGEQTAQLSFDLTMSRPSQETFSAGPATASTGVSGGGAAAYSEGGVATGRALKGQQKEGTDVSAVPSTEATAGVSGGGASVHSDTGVATGKAFTGTSATSGSQEATTGPSGGGAEAHSSSGVKTGRQYS